MSAAGSIPAVQAQHVDESLAEPAATLTLVANALSMGQFVQALERVDALATRYPANSEVLAHQGICRYLVGDSAAATPFLEAAIRLDPTDARALKFLASSLIDQEMLQAGLQAIRAAAKLTPYDVNVLLIAGNLCARMGLFEEGARFLNQAISLRPNAITPYYQLEVLSQIATWKTQIYEFEAELPQRRERVLQELLRQREERGVSDVQLAGMLAIMEGSPLHFSTALAIAVDAVMGTPDSPEVVAQLSAVFAAAGDGARLLQLAERRIRKEPQNAAARSALCNAWLTAGSTHWETAWRGMTRSLMDMQPQLHPQECTLWNGEPMNGEKILVYQDQGIGDAILAFRFLPVLAQRGVRFDLWVLPPLEEFARATSGWECLIQSPTIPDPGAHGCTRCVPLFGLIAALQLSLEEVRRLPTLLQRSKAPGRGLFPELRDAPRIGLCFGGNPDRRDDWRRCLPMDQLERLRVLSKVQWVNLTYDRRSELPAICTLLGMDDPMSSVKSFSETAAIIESLDAVVCIDSAIAHLAASLGRPTWVFAPAACDWRWQVGDVVTPWWPQVRLLRCNPPANWEEAMDQLLVDLRKFTSKGPTH